VDHVEEMNLLRHDLRQMLTVMQGLNEPGKERELEAYCLEVLTQMRFDADTPRGQGVNRYDAHTPRGQGVNRYDADTTRGQEVNRYDAL
jgi:hypothetical protein